jgi:hypothetical protein
MGVPRKAPTTQPLAQVGSRRSAAHVVDEHVCCLVAPGVNGPAADADGRGFCCCRNRQRNRTKDHQRGRRGCEHPPRHRCPPALPGRPPPLRSARGRVELRGNPKRPAADRKCGTFLAQTRRDASPNLPAASRARPRTGWTIGLVLATTSGTAGFRGGCCTNPSRGRWRKIDGTRPMRGRAAIVQLGDGSLDTRHSGLLSHRCSGNDVARLCATASAQSESGA